MKKFTLTAVLVLSMFSTAQSTVYYVSGTGNDNNNGISQSTPWKTISKVNSVTASFVAGDKVLFKSGDTFFGSVNIVNSGSAGNEIVVGSYGSGALPVITGKKLITGWSVYSGNIYRASFSDSVTHIFINGKLMTIARYPNQGYLKIDANIANTGIYDAQLNQTSGFWNGANCRVRTANWSYETKIVSNFINGTITFSSPTQFTTKPDYGYFLDNKLNLLDVQNEWYQDKATGYVYLYAPNGVNPNTLQVEGLVLKDGIFVTLSRHYIKIENLSLNGFTENGINAFTSSNVTVNGCTISETTVNGMRMNGSNLTVTNNTLKDNINNAVYIQATNGLIKNNTIKRTGLFPGYGTNARGYLGLNIHISTNLIVENNYIDSTGYSGMSVGKNSKIQNNVVNHSLLITNDGAGIDIADSDSLLILNNIIINTLGNTESSNNPSLYGSGIYMNAAIVKNSLIHNNTIASNSYTGIYFDHKNIPVNNTITNNVLYNNVQSQMIFSDFSAVVFIPNYNTVFKNNVLYCLSSTQFCLEIRGHTPFGISDYGNFDDNFYYNPYSDFIIKRANYLPVPSSNVHTLDYWKINFGEDLHSKSSPFKFSQNDITDTLSNNLIMNSEFHNNVDNWNAWPYGAGINHVNHPLLDSGTMKVTWNGQGYSESLTLSNTYPIVKDEIFLVNISFIGDYNGAFNLWGRSSLSSSLSTFPKTFLNFENYRKDYSFTFKADTTDPAAFVSVGLKLPDTLVYVDNIRIYKVNIQPIDSTKKSRLFSNENNYIQNLSLNGIAYKDLDGNPVTGNISLQPYSSKILINENYISSRNLQLKALIEGKYDSTSGKMRPDTVTVYLRNFTAPYQLIDSNKAALDSNGNGNFIFKKALNNINYYLVVSNLNSLETWSSQPVSFISDYAAYDFTAARNKAYGFNMKLVSSKACIYSGDLIKDGQIGLTDVMKVMDALNNFKSGIAPEDLNGDGLIDLKDLGFVFNNSNYFIGVKKP